MWYCRTATPITADLVWLPTSVRAHFWKRRRVMDHTQPTENNELHEQQTHRYLNAIPHSHGKIDESFAEEIRVWDYTTHVPECFHHLWFPFNSIFLPEHHRHAGRNLSHGYKRWMLWDSKRWLFWNSKKVYWQFDVRKRLLMFRTALVILVPSIIIFMRLSSCHHALINLDRQRGKDLCYIAPNRATGKWIFHGVWWWCPEIASGCPIIPNQ